MKRFILSVAAVLMGVWSLSAQTAVTVDSEKIFKSIDSYNSAMKTLDELGEQYQTQVDAKFKEVETLYNNYMNSQRQYLSESARTARENDILAKEEEAVQFQESIFGQNGTLMKKRVEMIQPIQERVFAAIKAYAEANGIDLVIDKAANPTLLYESAAADRTQAVIDILKK
ncbi:MAG: OmpH family outer membrane protein [Alistipes sp.]|nr:OmpH family outer membrane protein [Alistipes sp.]